MPAHLRRSPPGPAVTDLVAAGPLRLRRSCVLPTCVLSTCILPTCVLPTCVPVDEPPAGESGSTRSDDARPVRSCRDGMTTRSR